MGGGRLAESVWLLGLLGLAAPALGFARLTARERLGAVVAGTLALAAVVAAATGFSTLAWLLPAALAAVHGLAWLVASSRESGLPRVQARLFIAAGPLIAVPLAWNLNSTPVDGTELIAPSNASAPAIDPRYGPVTSVPTGQTVRTDRGAVVELRIMPRPPITPAKEREVEAWMTREFPQAVCVGPPDVSYNCHGWILTGGRYWIEGPDFAAILRDNGYQPHSDPKPDDLVVYFGRAGEIAHSGLVRQTSESGVLVVLVESKWGALHRVVHPVAAQPFGVRWTYFRAARPTHLLSIDGAKSRLEGNVPDRE